MYSSCKHLIFFYFYYEKGRVQKFKKGLYSVKVSMTPVIVTQVTMVLIDPTVTIY